MLSFIHPLFCLLKNQVKQISQPNKQLMCKNSSSRKKEPSNRKKHKVRSQRMNMDLGAEWITGNFYKFQNIVYTLLKVNTY